MQKQSIAPILYFFLVTAILSAQIAGCSQATPIDFSTSTQTVEANATATATIQSPPTSLSNTSYEDTGYEGYYNGIVVITEYYTLLGNGLHEDAYQILSSSARLHSQSQVEFVAAAQLAFKAVEIVTVQPLVVWQQEQGALSVIVQGIFCKLDQVFSDQFGCD